MRLIPFLLSAALVASPLAGLRAQTEAPALSLELNKLEPVTTAGSTTAGCRAYLVTNDPEGGPRYDALRLDLVLFGTDGVILRRLALDVGPVLPGRLQVRLFDIVDVPCTGIGQILINDSLICKAGGADQVDCMDRIRTTSRVSAKLGK